MLSHFTSVLTLAAMMLHSIIGCCWHHAHETCGLAGQSATCCAQHANSGAMPNAACFDGASDSAQGDQPSPAEDPCDHSHGGCTEPNCVYTLADHDPVTLHFAWIAAMLPMPVSTVIPVELPATEFVADVSSPPSAAQKVRALLQVWTI